MSGKYSVLSWLVPSVATIFAAFISVYAASTAKVVESRDLGSLEEGQKICVTAKTGVWHNISVVPKVWTVSMCNEIKNPFDGDAFYIGCAYSNKTVFGVKNDLTPPSPNCGW